MLSTPIRDDDFKRLELSRRLETFARASVFSLLASAVTLAVLMHAYAVGPHRWVLIGWAAVTFVFVIARMFLGRAILATDKALQQLRRQWRQTNWLLSIGSTIWGIGLVLSAWVGRGESPDAFSIVGGAMLANVLLIHRTTPVAAGVHLLTVGAGLIAAEAIAVGWAAWPVMALVVLMAVSLYTAIRLQDRRFIEACMIERKHRDSVKIIRLLLNEHEAQAADWLWTIDGEGMLREVSSRFADVVGLSTGDLEGSSFFDLLAPGLERDRLVGLIGNRAPFREELVPVHLDGQQRFWRLTGQPRSGGRMTGVGRDVTEQRAIEERVRYMAHYDPLTGLANRHLFNQRLRDALRMAEGKARQVALLYLDLDDFKAINDTQGHNFGDHLLRVVGERLGEQMLDGELVARLGGDEFAMLIETAAGDGMLIERAHRLLAAIREPFVIEGQSIRMSTSVGGARGEVGINADELMRRVDLALYAAKARGRDAFAMFDESLDQAARERTNIRAQLAEALNDGELELFYQPIIALDTGATAGYEALLRWRHPTRGLMHPDQFLPIAEESGLIIPLGDWVIRQALEDVSQWEGDFRISINLSPSQTRHSQLLLTVEEALAATGFPANRLEFEITEHVLIDDAAAGAAMLERLRAMGLQIALDDFGTGYSSLSYLRRYRFDRIKIDRSFVADVEESDEARAIISTLTRLADALGMVTTAEGIERPGQLDLLRKLGCNEAQGFLIMEPVSADQITTALQLGRDMPDGSGRMAQYRQARREVLRRRGSQVA